MACFSGVLFQLEQSACDTFLVLSPLVFRFIFEKKNTGFFRNRVLSQSSKLLKKKKEKPINEGGFSIDPERILFIFLFFFFGDTLFVHFSLLAGFQVT